MILIRSIETASIKECSTAIKKRVQVLTKTVELEFIYRQHLSPEDEDAIICDGEQYPLSPEEIKAIEKHFNCYLTYADEVYAFHVLTKRV